jgi:SAM-dependent methyltransferase
MLEWDKKTMKEEEIRQRKTFDNYLAMVEQDVNKFFNFESFVEIPCPACACNDLVTEFEKKGFWYVSCKRCATLFVNPRPSFKDLRRFYTNSRSTLFLINHFYPPVIEKRREKIYRPRAEYVCSAFSDKATGIIGDIGAGSGVFLEELKKLWPLTKLLAIEPSPEQAKFCQNRGVEIVCSTLEDMDRHEMQFDLLTSFELFEHLFDPYTFLCHVNNLLKSGGCFMMTTLNGQGFDLQISWEQSKSICPPQHLNFFNLQSISLLFERCGFEVLETATPGQLDWDIVEGMIKYENVKLNRFWHLIVDIKNEECKNTLQKWISSNNLSSHMRVVGRKRSS